MNAPAFQPTVDSTVHATPGPTPPVPRQTTACRQPLRTLDDIVALEARPYDELVPAHNVYQLFQATAAWHGGRPALTVLASADPQDVAGTWTHGALLAEITRAANLFAQRGIRGEAVVSIVSKTHAPVPALIWGAQTAGVASCLNPMLGAEVLAELLKAEHCQVLVCPGPQLDAPLWHKLRAVALVVPSIRHVLVMGGFGQGPDDTAPDARFTSLDDALAAQPGDRLLQPRGIGRDTLAALFHTGGTTGVPKLVPQTHGQQVHAAWCFAQFFAITEQDVGLNGLPMFHVGGTSTWGLSVLGAGGHIVVMGPVGYRDPAMVRQVWAVAAHFRATLTGSVPTTIGAMSEVPTEGHDLRTLRMAQTGGAVLPSAVAERFERRTGIPLLEQYGMTESVATIASTPFAGAHVRGSVGLRCPFSQLKVLRQTAPGQPAEEAAPDEIGLVVCRGRQIVSRYVDARHSQGAFTPDGWLITGDLGYLTPEGALVLTGREKDLIIRGGHNIDPAAIEEVANAHPALQACAAVGMPDAYAGEVPVLFAVPRVGQTPDLAELQAWLQQRIHEPPAKPRHVFVLDALPTTEVGKVFKPALRERALLEKLRLELAAVSPHAQVTQVAHLVAVAAGRRHQVTATLVPQDGVDRAAVEHALQARLADLPFDVALRWANTDAAPRA